MAAYEFVNGFYDPRHRRCAPGWKSPVSFVRMGTKARQSRTYALRSFPHFRPGSPLPFTAWAKNSIVVNTPRRVTPDEIWNDQTVAFHSSMIHTLPNYGLITGPVEAVGTTSVVYLVDQTVERNVGMIRILLIRWAGSNGPVAAPAFYKSMVKSLKARFRSPVRSGITRCHRPCLTSPSGSMRIRIAHMF